MNNKEIALKLLIYHNCSYRDINYLISTYTEICNKLDSIDNENKIKQLQEVVNDVYDILNNQFEAYLEPQDVLKIQKCKDLLKEVLKCENL